MWMFETFDYIDIEGFRCPICGRILDNWQTKDLNRTMSTYRPGDWVPIENGTVIIYTSCKHRIESIGKGSCDDIYHYRCKYLVRNEISIPVKDHILSKDGWKCSVRIIKGHLMGFISYFYIDPEKYNNRIKILEINTFGEPVELIYLKHRDKPFHIKPCY